MRLKNVVYASFLVFVIPAYEIAQPADSQKLAVVSGGLAEKLVNGSPWRFTTQYENTTHHFRLSPGGMLQRRSDANPDGWKDLDVSEAQIASYKTMNGHVITFSLGADGLPTANHSKHSSQFKSIKDSAASSEGTH